MIDLIRRQPIALEEFLGQSVGGTELGHEVGRELPDAPGQLLEFPQQGNEVVDRGGHGGNRNPRWRPRLGVNAVRSSGNPRGQETASWLHALTGVRLFPNALGPDVVARKGNLGRDGADGQFSADRNTVSSGLPALAGWSARAGDSDGAGLSLSAIARRI